MLVLIFHHQEGEWNNEELDSATSKKEEKTKEKEEEKEGQKEGGREEEPSFFGIDSRSLLTPF